MKIVQSFWSKPVFQNIESKHLDRAKGGWIDQKSHLMAWAFSCSQLRKFYDQVELVTDDLGKQLLIDLLQLPYTKVHLGLNDLHSANPDLWALGKLKAYSLQKEPFIHIDGDVFIFDKFITTLENSPLICQNLDIDHSDYIRTFNQAKAANFEFPQVLQQAGNNGESLVGCNAGIFGGNDLAFFRNYVAEAIKIVETNEALMPLIDTPTFNIIFEQLLFHELARKHSREVFCLFEPDIGDEPRHLVKYHDAPRTCKYVHMIAGYKRNKALIRRMLQSFRQLHPATYYAILNKLKVEGLA